MSTGAAGVVVRRADPAVEADLDAWHAVYAAAERAGLDDVASVWSYAECRESYTTVSPFVEHRIYLAEVAGEAVAHGYARIPLQDNLDAAYVQVGTRPRHERRGHATAVLAHLEAELAALGRTRLDSGVVWPIALGAEGEGWPGREFARRHGYRLTVAEVQRELALPVADAVLDRLAAVAADRHAGYEIRTFVGHVPDELAEGWVALQSTLATEAPTGDGEHEDDVADVGALRENEELMRRQGRVNCCACALRDGEVVAYTELPYSDDGSGRAYQWGTLVRADHRGRRLGLALKVANLRQLQALDLGARAVVTWNAEVNEHMIAVNEQLGFRPVARSGEFQKRHRPAGGG